MIVQFEVTETVRLRRTYEAKVSQKDVMECAGIVRREFLEDPEEHVEAFLEQEVESLGFMADAKLIATNGEDQEDIEFDEISDIEGLPCE